MGGENIYKRPGAVMQNRTEINSSESALRAGLNNAQIAIEMGSSLSRLVFKDADGTYRRTALVDEWELEARERTSADQGIRQIIDDLSGNIDRLSARFNDYALNSHTHQLAALGGNLPWNRIDGAPSIGSGEYLPLTGGVMGTTSNDKKLKIDPNGTTNLDPLITFVSDADYTLVACAGFKIFKRTENSNAEENILSMNNTSEMSIGSPGKRIFLNGPIVINNWQISIDDSGNITTVANT